MKAATKKDFEATTDEWQRLSAGQARRFIIERFVYVFGILYDSGHCFRTCHAHNKFPLVLFYSYYCCSL